MKIGTEASIAGEDDEERMRRIHEIAGGRLGIGGSILGRERFIESIEGSLRDHFVNGQTFHTSLHCEITPMSVEYRLDKRQVCTLNFKSVLHWQRRADLTFWAQYEDYHSLNFIP